MPKQVQISLSPEAAADDAMLHKTIAGALKVDTKAIKSVRIVKRSVDARQRNIKVLINADVFFQDEPPLSPYEPFHQNNVGSAREIIIAGAGPAGLFAALRLIELGYRPVIIERGRDVSTRKKDIARISREHIIDPDSNYCFGEGGAGTYSDGKLYTRSRKRGDNSRVLELLCLHGANQNILYEAHPHLGTDKLPGIISAIRKSIIDSGGVFLLENKITDLIINNNKISGVTVTGGETYRSGDVVLATGHSARDIFQMLAQKGARLEFKSFAMGVRAEHPQELIDRIQYHDSSRGKYLPAASYSLVRQVNERGVYSFCMCPGGFIVPSATTQEEVVVNGMSPSHRGSPFANSGIVVEIREEDLPDLKKYGILAGLEYQKKLEEISWEMGGRSQTAPAQRLDDFINGRTSGSLPKSSYFPGITTSPLHEWLPAGIAMRLKEGFRQFGNVMKGYVTNEAVILGVESRTSSPLRIPRDPETMEHSEITGLYPCGEGSGYAGGIVSSAVDGMRVAEAIGRKYMN